MGAIVGPFVLNTMEDRTIVCTDEEISAAGEERGKGKNRRLCTLPCQVLVNPVYIAPGQVQLRCNVAEVKFDKKLARD